MTLEQNFYEINYVLNLFKRYLRLEIYINFEIISFEIYKRIIIASNNIYIEIKYVCNIISNY